MLFPEFSISPSGSYLWLSPRPKKCIKLAKGSKIVNLFILITQFGFCCCYFVFMSANIRQVIYEYTPDGSKIKELLEHEDDANRVIMAILAVPICLICSVRNLGKFIGFVSHGSCDHFQFRSSGTLFRDSKCIHSSICRNHFLISGAKSSKSSGREFSKSSKLWKICPFLWDGNFLIWGYLSCLAIGE